MSLTITDLSSLDEAQVDLQQKLMLQMLTEYVPDISFKRGVMHDLVLHLNAVLAAANQDNLLRMLRSNSLLAITKDPTLATDSVVNKVLSNWGLTRRAGSTASGQILIKLSQQLSVVVPYGSVFTVSGVSFVSTQSFVSRLTEAEVIADTDRLLSDNGDGTWSFVIEAEAEAVGSNGNVKVGTAASMDSPVTKFSSAYVYADFVGGADEETNEQLLTRQLSGIAAKGISGRANIDALVKDQFPETTATSAVGFGDSEMLRDQHSVWPGSTGARCDLYVRTTESWLSETISVSASLSSKVGPVGTWQFLLNKDASPGFYEIEKVLPLSSSSSFSGFTPTLDTRSFDVTSDGNGTQPDIATAVEAEYSPYQISTVRFVDTVTDVSALSVGDTADYSVVIRRMPSVVGIQDLLRQRSVASPGGDILVKGAVPCFVGVSLTVNMPAGEELPAEDDVAAVVASYVGSLGFTQKLTASQIAKKIHDAYPTASVSDVALTGRIRKPGGVSYALSSTNALVIPDDPTNMVTYRTTAFLLSPTNVSVNVVSLD